MNIKTAVLAGATLIALSLGPASAETLRYAYQADVNSMDPYSINQTFTLGFLGNVYEGLTRRNADLEMEPSLATSWELLEPTRWRFHLREGVTFHNGNPFNADDVLFSFERVKSEFSDLKSRVSGITDAIKVDDYTVDFVTEAPNPIIAAEWDTWYIMDKEWAEANGAVDVTNVANLDQNSFANLNANGTGPFMLVSRQPDVKTVLEVNPDWWDEPEHNLTEVIYTPIASASTRVAALLSGEVDVMDPLPLQDIQRVEQNPGTRALTGPELRTIFLGMDQARDELLYSNVKGKNPFKDQRVRKAFYQAINMDAINKVVMRGQSTPTSTMVAPGINGFPKDLERHPYDPEAAKALLAEAGYPDGFQVDMNCPNDRYVNDEAICQAVVGMLAQIGVKVNLIAETNSVYFSKILAQGGYDTSFYLLGWTPSSFDSWNALWNLVATRDPERGRGAFNNGGYSNARIDELTDLILIETDQEKRNAMIHEAWQILHEEVGYLPLHQQALAWGASDAVELKQRADNIFAWRHVVITR